MSFSFSFFSSFLLHFYIFFIISIKFSYLHIFSSFFLLCSLVLFLYSVFLFVFLFFRFYFLQLILFRNKLYFCSYLKGKLDLFTKYIQIIRTANEFTRYRETQETIYSHDVSSLYSEAVLIYILLLLRVFLPDSSGVIGKGGEGISSHRSGCCGCSICSVMEALSPPLRSSHRCVASIP